MRAIYLKSSPLKFINEFLPDIGMIIEKKPLKVLIEKLTVNNRDNSKFPYFMWHGPSIICHR